MPILDTDFLIDLHDGDDQARQALLQMIEEPLVVPYQAALEFLHGALDWQSELAALDRAFQVVPPTEQVLAAAARMAAESRARNIRVRSADAWIAAHAQVMDTYVVSRNKKHYQPLGVPCRDWLAGPPP